MDISLPLEKYFRLSDDKKKALARLRIKTLKDLLYHFPSRYEDPGSLRTIQSLIKGDEVTIYGSVLSSKTGKGYKTKIPLGEAVISDGTGKIKIVWFHQAFLATKLKKGVTVKVSGKVQERKGELYLGNPEFSFADLELGADNTLFEKGEKSNLFPVYPETRGISSLWFTHSIQKVLRDPLFPELVDPIPETILKKYNLPKCTTALIWAHTPKKRADAESARKRFAFEEIFFIQLSRLYAREQYRSHKSFVIEKDIARVEKFIERFPFKETDAQKKAIETILSDMGSDKPMTRLLEGDVGSGKTAVAATISHSVVTMTPGKDGPLQVAYMAPTEILAEQHFQSFISLFSHLPISIGLITSSGCKKFPSKVDGAQATPVSRAQLLKWVLSGEIAILLGTHALIQKSVRFRNLSLVIVDEQHRFGTLQRGALTKKDERLPHFLSMTATPIPRTLALTIYGDLDLSLLDEMPVGRKAPITEIVFPADRKRAYQKIREEVAAGRQAYVICPRINEPDPEKEMALIAKSVKAETDRLADEVFPEYMVGMIHGKMKPQEKEYVMRAFVEKKIDILVATSVIEVGVNVPNATTILIEGAERFGLSQLHQLRGRVLRSESQAYCFLFPESKQDSTMNRLKALVSAKNGFELAEQDLLLRGPGELAGGKQWGVSDIGMEAIKNIKMVEAARTEARAVLETDPELKSFPEAKNFSLENTNHFE